MFPLKLIPNLNAFFNAIYTFNSLSLSIQTFIQTIPNNYFTFKIIKLSSLSIILLSLIVMILSSADVRAIFSSIDEDHIFQSVIL